LDIPLKKPTEYKMQDVLNIADKLTQRHKNASQVQNCAGIIRKCFRFAGQNSGVIKKLLDFAPTDSYGSMIYGGFALILGVSWSTSAPQERSKAPELDILYHPVSLNGI
jgi:hypothetical protein